MAAETLVEMLRDGASRYGDRPALLIKPGFRTRIWSHRDLADLAPRVAGILTAQGLEPIPSLHSDSQAEAQHTR